MTPGRTFISAATRRTRPPRPTMCNSLAWCATSWPKMASNGRVGRDRAGWGLVREPIAQHWIEPELAIAAADQGANVILSPATRAYLDMRYDLKTPTPGTFWAGLVDVTTAYDWDPGGWLEGVPDSQVAGVEAALWTETIGTREGLDVMIFPRLLGHAELGWSPWTGHDLQDYAIRLATHGPRLSAMGIGYFRSEQVSWPAGE